MARHTSLWLRDTLEAEIDARGTNFSQVVHRDLDRLYNALYRRALRTVTLTSGEACAVVDALNGALYDGALPASTWLYASLEDALAPADNIDWGINAGDLLRKLQTLTDVQALAVIDGAERFWVVCPPGNVREEVGKFLPVIKDLIKE